MRAGVIDIGSNSMKLVIGEKDDEQIKVLESLKSIVPIGSQAFLKGRISQEIINQTISVLERYKQVLKEYDVSNVRVIATTAVREASNKDIFLDTVFRKTGFNIEVLNVGDVVYYIDSFLALKLKKAYPILEKNLLIAELGGGSLDLSLMQKGYTLMNLGIPIGTLRLRQFRNKLDGSAEDNQIAIREYIENEILYIKQMFPDLVIDDVILIDESYTSYLQNVLSGKKLQSNFFQFKQKEAQDFLAKITETNIDELSSTYNIPQDIATTIDGYAIILDTLYKLIKNNYIYILETSLPEALLANILFDFETSKISNKSSQLRSVAESICKKFHMDLNHAKQVAYLSEELFNHMKGILGVADDDVLYLVLAAYLHDIGKFINNRSHHKHSEYMINALSLFRLKEEEIKLIACIARYHRRAAPMPAHLLYSSLPMEKQILVQKLCALLKLANSLDSSHKQKVKKIEVKIDRKQEITLIVYAQDNFTLERFNFHDKKELFEEISGNKINLIVKNEV